MRRAGASGPRSPGAAWLLLAAAACAPAPAVRAATIAADPLATPLDSSLAPPVPGSGWAPGLLSAPGAGGPVADGPVAGGVASTVFGSNGLRGSAIELDSGPIGARTRASLLVSAVQGPHFHDLPSVSTRTVAVGVQTELPFGARLGIVAGLQNNRVSRQDLPGSP